MAPTILDYLDISSENYFLGNSLFADEEIRVCETCYNETNVFYSSKYSAITEMGEEQKAYLRQLLIEYYIKKENP